MFFFKADFWDGDVALVSDPGFDSQHPQTRVVVVSLILALRRLRQDNREGDVIYQLWSTAGLERDYQNLMGLSMGRGLEEAWPGCLCSSS